MRDIFCPTKDPARSIYLALVDEMGKRSGRSVSDWILAEREAVLREARIQAQVWRLKTPTLEEVESAESCACGHTDYAAKFAYGVQRIMTSPKYKKEEK
jgi:hypothetical protein